MQKFWSNKHENLSGKQRNVGNSRKNLWLVNFHCYPLRPLTKGTKESRMTKTKVKIIKNKKIENHLISLHIWITKDFSEDLDTEEDPYVPLKALRSEIMDRRLSIFFSFYSPHPVTGKIKVFWVKSVTTPRKLLPPITKMVFYFIIVKIRS